MESSDSHPKPEAARLPPAIGDYALIGDCRTAALVSKDGSIDWCCFPDFDSPPVFARLLDPRGGGHFSIQPAAPWDGRQRYLDETNVVVTRYHTAEGVAHLTDFMPIATGLVPLRQVVRQVMGVSGETALRMEFAPRPDFARRPPRLRRRSPHSVHVDLGGSVLHLLSEAPLDVEGETVRASFTVRAGEKVTISLAYEDVAPGVFPAVGQEANRLLAETVAFWRAWCGECTYQGPYGEAVHRSALVLKLMQFAPSRAIIAAPTTSLPERLGGVRNWDYRYCWLRDASFYLSALQGLGYRREAEGFLEWLLHSTNLTRPRLGVVYTVYGEPNLAEREVPGLAGYRGSRPVRAGNLAAVQTQLDVYGEVIEGLFGTAPQEGRRSRDVRRLLRETADWVARHWRDEDNGIWEMRRRGQFTQSKVACWHALDRALRLLASDSLPDKTRRFWEKTRGEIARAVLDLGYNREMGAFTQTLGGSYLDAALLIAPFSGLVDAADPRFVSTVDAMRRGLGCGNGLLYRYLTPDGLPPGEGAFLACSFWLAEVLCRQGRLTEARDVFERVLRCANHLGLLSEQADPATSEPLGNFPQALSHVGLINAALAIQKAEATGGRAPSSPAAAARGR